MTVSGAPARGIIRVLIAKPGLDGHDVGAKVLCRALMDAGMEVVYTGLRQSPAEIARTALEEDVDVVGLSILSGSHVELVREVVRLMGEAGMGDVPVVVGGIIPAADAGALGNMGVARIYTPKDYDLNRILGEVLDLLE